MKLQVSAYRSAVREVAALLVIAAGGLFTLAEPPPAKSDLPEPVPAAIVTAWQDAGAQVGWQRSIGPDIIPYLDFVEGGRGKRGDLPAFRFVTWKDGLIAKLPDVGRPFGLDLAGAQVTDAGLKELAGLKSLQTLDLVSTRVTDAGLNELAGLTNLQRLHLGGTDVAGPGLKELAGLKGLQTLGLVLTRVTDAGMKGLAEFKNLHTLNLGLTGVTDAGLKELNG